MIVDKFEGKVRCDVSGCENLSCYKIVNKKFVFNGTFYLCDNCLNKVYELIGKFVVPKSPQPIYKKKGVKDEQDN